MRERLDCAVLHTDCTRDWVSHWMNRHVGGRLNVQALGAHVHTEKPGSCRLLSDSALILRRFDACLLPVSECNLVWARTTLQAAQGVLQTPVLALVRQLKATALNDLYGLGLADFVRDPVCSEELRVRVEHLLDRRPYPVREPSGPAAFAQPGPAAYGKGGAVGATIDEASLCSSILDRSGAELDAFAIASASRCATSRESFRVAKSKVVERFERAYITAALGRHSGNIAMAARAAQKHRRAFWALMRKHQIDAAPYRAEGSQHRVPDG